MDAQSAVTITEQELVRWAFCEFPMNSLLLSPIGITTASMIDFEVGAPVIEPAHRETQNVDVLIFPQGDPSRATAIECKRVTIRTDTFFTEQVGKLGDIRKAVQQANGHVARGFHQVYLAIFAVVDGREVSGGSWIGGGLNGALIKIVRDRQHFAGLHPSVGILLLEVRQPVDKDVRLGGGFGLLDHQPAAPRQQEPALTGRIAALVPQQNAQSS